ncbi:acyl-CoA dehydrogenase family protein [Endozoicomonadaceae bacterium StTr2]
MLFTEEHKAIQKTVRDFVEKELNPHTEEWEKAGAFPAHEVFKKMGDLGLLGITKPEAHGGLGLDYSYQVAFSEELGLCQSGGVSLAIGVQTDMATPALARFGSNELKEEFLAPAIAGEKVASIAVSEPGAGSDVAATKTQARKDGDDYIINGTKMWITNATQADFFCLLANTSDDPAHKNKSLIVVPSHLPGISFSEKLNKFGMRSSDTAQVFFDDVRVPRRNLIGQEGAGFTMQMIQFQEERLFGSAMGLKSMESCLNDTIEYLRERKTFGQPVLHNQVIHYRLAELQTEIEALRALVYQATETYINGGDVTKLASMAKLKAGRLTREVTDTCVQYWGGMGYMFDNQVNRYHRDLRLTGIGGGADEIMLGIITKLMGIAPKVQAYAAQQKND